MLSGCAFERPPNAGIHRRSKLHANGFGCVTGQSHEWFWMIIRCVEHRIDLPNVIFAPIFPDRERRVLDGGARGDGATLVI